MAYDIFVSYSRKDNQQGRVSELVQHIQDDYQRFAVEKLSCFFDVTEIKAMDDWRNRILGALRESKLLLLVLSPDYLASPYCEWEIVEFLKYECSRSVQGQGVAQVYFVEIPGLDTSDFEKQAAAWVARVRQRNHVDLRSWRDAGADALKRKDVRARLDDLERSLADRLSRLRRSIDAPGNLPAHNPRFVGREVEMARLHKAAGLGQFGVITAVQGVGGMGKTALSIQYAYAYADFYTGGRWLVGCAGSSSLAVALRSLDSDLGLQFTDEEKLDDTRAAKRVLSELEKRSIAGVASRIGEKDPPEPRALLILDNVDNAALLQAPQVDLLSGRKWLHVITTTRLDPGSIGMEDAQCHLPVDELPEDDALRLIESYLPQSGFLDEAECSAARDIVRLLRGFTLAVEVVAVHLGERKGRLACADLLSRLRREGMDGITNQTTGGVRHAEKLLSATLEPTLETLSEAEKLALAAASLLPPDSVALPWLRAVVTETHTELGKDSEPGYDDPWITLINHLIGLRLLQVIEWSDDHRTPLLCRMHRLIQVVVKQRAAMELNAVATALMNVATVRAQLLQKGWLQWSNRWEIKPLCAFALQAFDNYEPKASWLAGSAATCMQNLGDYAGADSLFRRALEARERVLGPEHPDTLNSVNNLASLLLRKGDYAGADPLVRRALEARERVLGPEHPDTLSSVDNLAVLLSSKGDYAGADPLVRRALEARERVLGPEHPDTLSSVNNLAVLLERKGDYVGADPLYRRALEARERVLGLEHPSTLNSVNKLARLLKKISISKTE